jgi:hypothetical protein
MLKSSTTSTDRATETREVDRATGTAVSVHKPRRPFLDFRRSPDVSAEVPTEGHGPAESGTDAVMDKIIEEVVADPDAIGLVLHGSRALGTASADSNYDFVCLLTEDAYERRRQRGTIVERRFSAGRPTVEIRYEGVGSFRRTARAGSLRGATFAFAKVLVDKIGEVEPLVELLAAAGEAAHDSVADEYDRYLQGFAQSLKAWSRGDDLGSRAHAAQSGLALMNALFGLEGKAVPYLDQLSLRLGELDEPQRWRPGFLSAALHRLFYAPDPPFQQMLEKRVSRLMESRGVRHQWRHDLDRLRVVRYDEL